MAVSEFPFDQFFFLSRNDTVRFALDVLAILTVVPKIQLQLAESVDVLDEAGSTVSTVGRLYLAIFVIAWFCFPLPFWLWLLNWPNFAVLEQKVAKEGTL